MESIASNSLRISRPIRGSSPIIFENSMLDPTWTHQFKWHDFHGCIRMKINALRGSPVARSEEHTSELQSLRHLVCRLLLEKKKKNNFIIFLFILYDICLKIFLLLLTLYY